MLMLQWPSGIGIGPSALPEPPPLPGAPLLDQVLFEQVWLLSAPLAALAVVALFVFNARGELKRGGLVAGGLLVLAVAAWLVSTLVVTPREEVRGRTREVIDAVARADLAALDELLSPDVEIRYEGFASPTRGDLMRTIGRVMGEGGVYHLASWRVAEMQGTLDGPALARTQVLVRATHEASTLPASAWVLLKWELGGDGTWRCFVVEPIEVR